MTHGSCLPPRIEPERKIFGLCFSEIIALSRYSMFFSPFNSFFRQSQLLLYTSKIVSCGKALSKLFAVFFSMLPGINICINCVLVSASYSSYFVRILHPQSFDPYT